MNKHNLIAICALACGIASFIWIPQVLHSVAIILLAILGLLFAP